MTRPALSKQVQQILLRMAQGGQLRGRVSDDQLVGLLEQVRVSLTMLCPQSRGRPENRPVASTVH